MARDFDSGSLQSLNVGTAAALQITGNMSLSCWFNPASGSAQAVLLGCYDPSSPFTGWGYALSIGGSGKQHYWSNAIGSWQGSTSTYSVGSWQQGGFTINGSTGTFYLGGSSDGTWTQTSPGTYSGNKAIGATAGGASNQYDGILAMLAVWDGAVLTAGEMAALGKGYDPRLIRSDALVAYWPLWGNSDPEPDYAGNNTGAVANGPITKAAQPLQIMPRGIGATFEPEAAAGGGSVIPQFYHHRHHNRAA